jgi:AcrR family transcriptional regulator
MDMSIPYVDTGRTGQKMRTRRALIEAARGLIERGHTPTVEDAAAEASVSRTTAYRYFPNQRDLIVAAYPEVGAESLLPEGAPSDPAARLELVLDRYLHTTVRDEAALRTAFRLSLAPGANELVLRRGRVIGWVEEVLAPLRDRMSAKQIGRLARAIRAAAGVEALIWLCDVGGLSRSEAVKLMKWSAHALLRAAVEDAAQKPRSQALSR